MTSFLEDLWGSIFTPGPTPTLLVATNATFAALQSLLLILLVSTFSIHFLILSILSAGLWWAINWFAAELQAAKNQEEAKLRKESKQKSGGNDEDDDADNDEADDETDPDTEIEDLKTDKFDAASAAKTASREETPLPTFKPSASAPNTSAVAEEPVRVEPGSVSSSGYLLASTDEANLNADALRKRFSIGDRSGGEFSTDSEWEKVEGENDRER